MQFEDTVFFMSKLSVIKKYLKRGASGIFN